MIRTLSLIALAALFVTTGTLHFVIPEFYLAIMPPALPAQEELVLLTGAMEIAGGVGLLFEVTRRWAAIGLIALLVAILPANLQMLLDARAAGASPAEEALLWVRLPLQGVLIWCVWRAGGAARLSDRTAPLADDRSIAR